MFVWYIFNIDHKDKDHNQKAILWESWYEVLKHLKDWKYISGMVVLSWCSAAFYILIQPTLSPLTLPAENRTQ